MFLFLDIYICSNGFFCTYLHRYFLFIWFISGLCGRLPSIKGNIHNEILRLISQLKIQFWSFWNYLSYVYKFLRYSRGMCSHPKRIKLKASSCLLFLHECHIYVFSLFFLSFSQMQFCTSQLNLGSNL